MKTYKIVRGSDGSHGSELGSDAPKGSGVQAATAAASNAIRDGTGVTITVEPRVGGETELGGKP